MRHEPKRSYDPPRMLRVPLVPEEAVLTVCKTGQGAGRTTKCNKNQGACVNQSGGS